MKKNLILIVLVILVSCCTVTEEQRDETHYLNEDFILVEKEEIIEHEDGNTYQYRLWKFSRVDGSVDSTTYGEIKSRVTDNNGNCNNGNFYITNELWYNKEVGDVLHFEFIRKDRFYNVANLKIVNNKYALFVDVTGDIVDSPDVRYSSSDVDYSDRLRAERRIPEIEEQLITLQAELSELKKLIR